ncbi:MAG: class I SAM-dependent DNA methyltransferase, partial [Verrucomicrobiales bacterium]|nr:class I SAM-dependent DNA methyltransferase [Verrucomicrobiales bacterium]
AAFEEPVRKLSGNWGFIDLFWPGTCLVEHKSAGQDLSKAHTQGMDYVRGLIDSGREKEAPRWLIVSDFERIAIHDLEPEQDPDLPLFTRLPPSVEFPLKELHKHVRHFAFIAGYKYHKLNPEDPANFEATELMARLHDALYDGGYHGHELCQFLVRLLFCFFADDTGIFPSDQFKLFLREHTTEDGSDLGPKLAHLFQVLNTPEDRRGKNLDEDLAQFPYINGALFQEPLQFADFTTKMREVLLECADFKWEKISPAVFGSLFQTVFDHEDDRKRRQLGAHYTAEQNIMKVVRSLFLDHLRAEFESAKRDKSGRGPGRLRDLQKHLAALKIMDPACGCGNFLVVTYRELRQLELEILLELYTTVGAGEDAERRVITMSERQHEFTLDDVNQLSQINVDQMYGIEIEEFPARIAEVALCLTDHQANLLLSEAFGQLYRRIPLRNSPNIHVGNALRTDWKKVLPPEQCSYILGNPPFIGGKFQSREQRADMNSVTQGIRNAGLLDFVTGWYFKAATYMQGSKVLTAFVSTNSITQGEQVGTLWNPLFQRFGVKIHFGHRSFPWQSEARGKAHVHCVIIGFACFPASKCLITDNEDPEHPTTYMVGNVSPYLVEGEDRAITSSSHPLSPVPEIAIGNKPIDGGNYLFSTKERAEFLSQEPQAAPWFRRWFGADEFINGIERWCLWLGDCPPNELKKMPLAMKRVDAVRSLRLASDSEGTRRIANIPTRFHVENMPSGNFLVIPEVSSERRSYIPIGFMHANDGLFSNKVRLFPDATTYHFGVLTSGMHMAWVRQVTGRLESRFQYSVKLVYNNYPWPQGVSDGQKATVEKAAQAVLDARAKFPTSTLADLYDPTTMPPALAKAHAELDRAVDRCYRKDPFPNDRARVEHLFALYEQLTAPMVTSNTARTRKKK